MERAATTQDARTKLVYVMGAGHSGSTILGVALGNCADFFYAGEVEEWMVNAGKPPWMSGERHAFWEQVTAQTDGADLFGSEALYSIERSSALLRVDRWSMRRRLLSSYRRVCQELLRAIARTAGTSHVVDTSHFPLRARELKRLRDVDLFLLFLVRDPHGVVDSNLRQFRPHEIAERRWRTIIMNVNLWLTLLVSVAVFLGHRRDRRLFVRHEDFVSDPEGVLRQILDVVGSDAQVPDLSDLRVGAPLEGNRLIRTKRISLERRPQHPTRGSLLTTVMQLPWRPVLDSLRPVATVRPAERAR
jgi:hypothetical protein